MKGSRDVSSDEDKSNINQNEEKQLEVVYQWSPPPPPPPPKVPLPFDLPLTDTSRAIATEEISSNQDQMGAATLGALERIAGAIGPNQGSGKSARPGETPPPPPTQLQCR